MNQELAVEREYRTSAQRGGPFRQHRTVVLFGKVWPAVEGEAKRSHSLAKALTRMEHILKDIPRAIYDGADIVRWCIRERFATVDGPLIGGKEHISETQKRGWATHLHRCPYCTRPAKKICNGKWQHTCGRKKCIHIGQRNGSLKSKIGRRKLA